MKLNVILNNDIDQMNIFFLLLFERIYIKFQNFIRTGYLHCIPQGTTEYLPNTKDELFKQYKIIEKPSLKFQLFNQPE
ncbi:unnamed protein product [Rotaria sp. Silwood2]|nr:unnamed protein product [Rotaria sp. Silwood2]CAF4359814.1 unnamed protein product [Rotaria sp. Silwood2]CAF4799645.1 unnamed protein product [Rotaria sp. Silwood2]